MSQYSNEELLSLTRAEAQEELSEEQLKRYNSLKAKKLHEQIDEHKEDKKKENIEGLGQLLTDVREDMVSTVEIAGNNIEILVDPDEHDIGKIKKAQKLADKNEDEIDEETSKEIKDELLEIIAEFTVNYSKEDWKEEFEKKEVGLMALGRVLYPILESVEEELKQKKRR